MYIGQARVIVKNAEGIHVFKRCVNLGETRESVLEEAKSTFSLFEIVLLNVKWYFNSEVRKQLAADFLTTPRNLCSPDKTLALWIES